VLESGRPIHRMALPTKVVPLAPTTLVRKEGEASAFPNKGGCPSQGVEWLFYFARPTDDINHLGYQTGTAIIDAAGCATPRRLLLDKPSSSRSSAQDKSVSNYSRDRAAKDRPTVATAGRAQHPVASAHVAQVLALHLPSLEALAAARRRSCRRWGDRALDSGRSSRLVPAAREPGLDREAASPRMYATTDEPPPTRRRLTARRQEHRHTGTLPGCRARPPSRAESRPGHFQRVEEDGFRRGR